MSRVKWAGLKHDKIDRARSDTNISGLCLPEARTGSYLGLASGSSCQAWHDLLSRARLSPMVGLVSPSIKI
jgi:hypothetical protein